MRRYLLAALLVVIGYSSPVGRELTLGEALRLSTEHSHALKSATARTAAAEGAQRAALADRLPTMSVAAFGLYNSEVPTLDIELPPPVGVSFSREVGTDETYQADLRLSLPLFTGGLLGANIDRARAWLTYTDALAQAERDQVLLQTRLAYLLLARADRVLDAACASLRRAEIIAADVGVLFDGGMADSVDILEARLGLDQAHFREQSAAIGRRSAEIMLLTLTGLPATEQLEITGFPEAIPGELMPSTVLPGKPELKVAEAGVELSLSGMKAARAGYYPTLSAYAGYSYGRPNLDRFRDTWNDYFNFGANLVWSFNAGNKVGAGVRAAEHEYGAACSERERTAEVLDREAKLSLQNLKLARKRYETARRHLRVTSDSYRLATVRHREGVLSANRLLEIEASLTEAESLLAGSLVDFFVARSVHYFAIGSDKLREGF